jgi:hypothetical protein
MKKISILSLLLLLLVSGSVVAQDVRYNFDKNAPFSNYKTYKWVEIKDSQKVNEIVTKQIKDTINAELRTKGLTEVTDKADLFMGYQTAIGQEKQFSSYSTGWGAGPGWYGRGWYGAGGTMTTSGQTSTILIGALALDMYDSAKQNLVWRGMVSKTIDQKAKPEKQQKNLTKAVQKLLKNYPPPVK